MIPEDQLHTFVMRNGRHAGARLVNVPVSYLRWMVSVNHMDAAWAEAEMKRRGTVVPELEVSGHAIDRASLMLRKTWHEDRGADEGLHAWLVRVAQEALAQGTLRTNGKIYWKMMKFKFTDDTRWPVLLTVMPAKPRPPFDAVSVKPAGVSSPVGS